MASMIERDVSSALRDAPADTPAVTTTAGRVCPLACRYGAAVLARAPERVVDTL